MLSRAQVDVGGCAPLAEPAQAAAAFAGDAAILLVPDVVGQRRARLVRALEGRDAVVGPTRRWTAVAASVHRVRLAQRGSRPVPGAPAQRARPVLEVLPADVSIRSRHRPAGQRLVARSHRSDMNSREPIEMPTPRISSVTFVS